MSGAGWSSVEGRWSSPWTGLAVALEAGEAEGAALPNESTKEKQKQKATIQAHLKHNRPVAIVMLTARFNIPEVLISLITETLHSLAKTYTKNI